MTDALASHTLCNAAPSCLWRSRCAIARHTRSARQSTDGSIARTWPQITHRNAASSCPWRSRCCHYNTRSARQSTDAASHARGPQSPIAMQSSCPWRSRCCHYNTRSARQSTDAASRQAQVQQTPSLPSQCSILLPLARSVLPLQHAVGQAINRCSIATSTSPTISAPLAMQHPPALGAVGVAITTRGRPGNQQMQHCDKHKSNNLRAPRNAASSCPWRSRCAIARHTRSARQSTDAALRQAQVRQSPPPPRNAASSCPWRSRCAIARHTRSARQSTDAAFRQAQARQSPHPPQCRSASSCPLRSRCRHCEAHAVGQAIIGCGVAQSRVPAIPHTPRQQKILRP